jgi:hypothetical protein
MRGVRKLLLVALLAGLIAAPAASAKEFTKVRACGTDACVTTRDHLILRGLVNGGPPTVPPSVGGSVFRLTATVVEPSGVVVARPKSWWMPSERLLVTEDGVWMHLRRTPSRALDRVVAGLQPFPATRVGLKTSAPAHAPARRDDRGTSWLLPIALAAAALLGAGALLLAVRRGLHPVKHGV